MIQWHLKTYDELTKADLWAILSARISTFVVEQERPYQEADHLDHVALHLWAEDDGELLAYARMYKENDYISFGRVLTASQARGKGLGKALVEHILKNIQLHYDNPIVIINAQADKELFYEKFGFKADGDVFTHHHTPHIKMTLDLNKK
ncbi:GNAT family N-acetyltransferase [Apilactobacillus xinyiensis]|uniref:GNAT family N-acetyltransferase n=1 Tax=Apilactobacillus xinyiensis TaxID=2841032 RepID=UPI001C7D7908|nr:GNAT family N-acetyltransferase [Apilactobacillus xinyiensis]